MLRKILILSFLSLFSYINLSTANLADTNAVANSQEDVPQQSQNSKPKILELQGAWARPSLSPNKNSAIYLKIKNNSTTSYTLVRASTIVSNRTELHQSYMDENKVSKMVTINKIVIPAKSEIDLEPGGMHIMLFDLKRTLKNGDKFKADLKFEINDQSTNIVNATVEESVNVEVKFNSSN